MGKPERQRWTAKDHVLFSSCFMIGDANPAASGRRRWRISRGCQATLIGIGILVLLSPWALSRLAASCVCQKPERQLTANLYRAGFSSGRAAGRLRQTAMDATTRQTAALQSAQRFGLADNSEFTSGWNDGFAAGIEAILTNGAKPR